MSEIRATYPIFLGLDGIALALGYVYIGLENQDPQTSPKAVYWDAALTIPVTQPIRTLAGLPDNAGTPGRIYTDGKYSIRVRNQQGVQVYAEASVGEASASAAASYYDVVINFSGTPGAQAMLDGITFVRSVTFPLDFTGSAGDVRTPGLASYTFSVQKNGVEKGTIVVDTSGNFTFATTGGATIPCVFGDNLRIIAPSSIATIADFTITLVGTLV